MATAYFRWNKIGWSYFMLGDTSCRLAGYASHLAVVLV